MLRSQRTGADVNFASKLLAGGAISVFAAILGGCSTDFKRLEQPSYTVGETNSLPPRPSEPIRRSNAGAPVGAETWPESGPRAIAAGDGRSAAPAGHAAGDGRSGRSVASVRCPQGEGRRHPSAACKAARRGE